MPKVNQYALAELLTFGWAAGGLSNYDGIERIAGGTVLRISLSDGAVQRRRFYDVLDSLCVDEDIHAENVHEIVASFLTQSVSAHLASDVGYTAQLSGGVDSSLTSAIAAQYSSSPIATYGVKLEDPVYDESMYRDTVSYTHLTLPTKA